MASSPGDDKPSPIATATTPRAYRWRQPDDDASVHSSSPTDVRLLFSVEVSSSSHSSQKGSSSHNASHSLSMSASSLSITTATNPYIGEDDLSSIESPSSNSQKSKLTISSCHGLPMALPPLGLDDDDEEEYLLGSILTTAFPKIRRQGHTTLAMHPSKKPELIPQKPSQHRRPQPPSNDNSMVANHNPSILLPFPNFDVDEELKQADEEFEWQLQKAEETFEVAALSEDVPRRLSDKALEKAAAAVEAVFRKSNSFGSSEKDSPGRKQKKAKKKKSGKHDNSIEKSAAGETPVKERDVSFATKDLEMEDSPPKSNDTSFVTAKMLDTPKKHLRISPEKTPSKSTRSFATALETPQKIGNTPLKTPSKTGRNTSFATSVSIYETPRQDEISPRKTPSKSKQSPAASVATPKQNVVTPDNKTPSKSVNYATPKKGSTPPKTPGRVVLFDDNTPPKRSRGAATKSKGGVLTGNWIQDTPNKTSTKLIFLGEERTSLLDSSLETDWSSSVNASRDESETTDETNRKAKLIFRTPLTKPPANPATKLYSQRSISSEQEGVLEGTATSTPEVVQGKPKQYTVRDDRSMSTATNSTTKVVRPKHKIYGAFYTPEKDEINSQSTSTHSQSTTQAVRLPHNIHEAFVTPEKDLETPEPKRSKRKDNNDKSKKHFLNLRCSKDDMELLGANHPSKPLLNKSMSDTDMYFSPLKADVSSLYLSPEKEDDNTMVTPRGADLARVFCDDMSDIVPMEDADEELFSTPIEFGNDIQKYAQVSFESGLVLDEVKGMQDTFDGGVVLDPQDEDDSVVSEDLKDFMQTAEVVFNRSIEERNASFDDQEITSDTKPDMELSDEIDDEEDEDPLDEDSIDSLREELAVADQSFDIEETRMSVLSDEDTMLTDNILYLGSPPSVKRRGRAITLPFPWCSPEKLFTPHSELIPLLLEAPQPEEEQINEEPIREEIKASPAPAEKVNTPTKGPALGSIRGPDFDPITPEEAVRLYRGSLPYRKKNRRSLNYILHQIRAYSCLSSVEAVSDGVCVDCAIPTQRCRCPQAPDDVLRRRTLKVGTATTDDTAKLVVVKASEASKKGRIRKKKKKRKMASKKSKNSSDVAEYRGSGESIPAPAPSLEEIKAIEDPAENRLSLHSEPPQCQWSLEEMNKLVPQPPGSPPISPHRRNKADASTAHRGDPDNCHDSNGSDTKKAKSQKKKTRKRKRLLRAIRKRLGRLRKRWKAVPKPEQ